MPTRAPRNHFDVSVTNLKPVNYGTSSAPIGGLDVTVSVTSSGLSRKTTKRWTMTLKGDGSSNLGACEDRTFGLAVAALVRAGHQVLGTTDGVMCSLFLSVRRKDLPRLLAHRSRDKNRVVMFGVFPPSVRTGGAVLCVSVRHDFRNKDCSRPLALSFLFCFFLSERPCLKYD